MKTGRSWPVRFKGPAANEETVELTVVEFIIAKADGLMALQQRK